MCSVMTVSVPSQNVRILYRDQEIVVQHVMGVYMREDHTGMVKHSLMLAISASHVHAW